MLYIKEHKNILNMLLPGADEYHSLLESIGDFLEQEILPGAKKVDQGRPLSETESGAAAEEGDYGPAFS